MTMKDRTKMTQYYPKADYLEKVKVVTSSLVKGAKIIHALCYIVFVYFLEACQVTWHL